MSYQLQIRHVGTQDGKPHFKVVRGFDGKDSETVSLIPPSQTVVEGRPDRSKKALVR